MSIVQSSLSSSRPAYKELSPPPAWNVNLLLCACLTAPYALFTRNIYIITHFLHRSNRLDNITSSFVNSLKDLCLEEAKEKKLSSIDHCIRDFSTPLTSQALLNSEPVNILSPIAVRLITAIAIYLIEESDLDSETKKASSIFLKTLGAGITATAAAFNFLIFSSSRYSLLNSFPAQLACLYSATSISFLFSSY